MILCSTNNEDPLRIHPRKGKKPTWIPKETLTQAAVSFKASSNFECTVTNFEYIDIKPDIFLQKEAPPMSELIDASSNPKRKRAPNKSQSNLDRSKNQSEDVDKAPKARHNPKRCFKGKLTMKTRSRPVPKKRFMCNLCRRTFATDQCLEEHRRSHDIDYVQCSICNLKFKTIMGLKQHHLRAHNTSEPKFTCDHCGSRHKLKNDLFLHISRTHMSGIQACRFCGKMVKDIRNHEARHRERLRGTTRQYSCPLCEKQFGSKLKLDNHLVQHQQEYVCSECDMKFVDPKEYTTHRRLKHKQMRMICTICEKDFSTSNNFYRHVLTHAGIKPYKCDVCEEVFTQRSSMLRHRRSHPAPLPPSPPPIAIAELARWFLQRV
ncbi:zinc finger protein 701 [Orussus abietinus]|uniref:zinc finger protein 701 n=1 Tax=Orussus abietinus TaxID=222816 RepID=UPI0006250E06|nr:zinc finger protein 701 [Orussus abietinus]